MKKILMLGLTVLLGACNTMNATPNATLDGEVYYLERIGLPKTATYEVSLQDVSLADAPAVTLPSKAARLKARSRCRFT